MYKKKLAVMALSAALAASTCLAGCSGDDDNYSYEDDTPKKKKKASTEANDSTQDGETEGDETKKETDKETGTADSKGGAPAVDPAKGQIYVKKTVRDTVVDIPAFTTIIPDGWEMTIMSNWQMIDNTYPGRELVQIADPDGTVRISIVSPQSYLWIYNDSFGMPSQNAGADLSYYTTFYPYMNAGDALEALLDSNGFDTRTMKKEVDDGEQAVKAADAAAQRLADINADGMRQMGVESYGKSYSIVGKYADYSKRQYTYNGGEYFEASTITYGFSGRLSGITTNTTTGWIIPYFIVYGAKDKATFDKYYDIAGTIIENSSFSPEFFYLNAAYASAILEQIAKIQAIRSQAQLDAVNESLMDDYSSDTNADARSTSEKVMEMWDDYINDVDAYVSEDGSVVKTSIYNEVMAQDGDYYYAGDKSGIPDGYTQLDKYDISRDH
ncbi:MAG: hypothetical protein IKN24_08965 [Lachnospiraceae bacterium]|nr:hypothetical protein [Lachnospiraceae bacterium]